jgi:hypothetical protein
VSRQQEGFGALTQGWVGLYTDFYSPFTYAQQSTAALDDGDAGGVEH